MYLFYEVDFTMAYRACPPAQRTILTIERCNIIFSLCIFVQKLISLCTIFDLQLLNIVSLGSCM